MWLCLGASSRLEKMPHWAQAAFIILFTTPNLRSIFAQVAKACCRRSLPLLAGPALQQLGLVSAGQALHLPTSVTTFGVALTLLSLVEWSGPGVVCFACSRNLGLCLITHIDMKVQVAVAMDHFGIAIVSLACWFCFQRFSLRC